MKNIFKNLLIFSVTFILIVNINIITRAEDETTPQVEASNVEENTPVITEIQPRTIEDDSPVTTSDSMPIDSGIDEATNTAEQTGNFYSFSAEDVIVDKDIYGDAFICSAETVTINSNIWGNVFVFAPEIIVSEQSIINNSLFCAAKQITIYGTIGGNVYSASNDFTAAAGSYINWDLFSAAKNINIKGFIFKNAHLVGDNITLDETANIRGNLEYTSDKIIGNSDDIVEGNVNFFESSKNSEKIDTTSSTNLSDWIYSAVSYIALTLILFVLYKLAKCKFTIYDETLTSKLPKCLLYGLAVVFGAPILCTILLFPVVTISASLVLFTIYILLFVISSCNTVIVLSTYANNKLQEKINLNDTLRTVLSIVVISLIYKLIQLVPLIGGLTTFAFVLIGFGLIINYLFIKDTKVQ